MLCVSKDRLPFVWEEAHVYMWVNVVQMLKRNVPVQDWIWAMLKCERGGVNNNTFLYFACMKRNRYLSLLFILCLAVACQEAEQPLDKKVYDTFRRQQKEMLGLLEQQMEDNGRTYADFEQQKLIYRDQYAFLKPYYEHAQEVKRLSDSLAEELQFMKGDLTAEVQGGNRESALAKGIDDGQWENWSHFEVAARYFAPQSSNGKAAELKQALAVYHAQLVDSHFLFFAYDGRMLHPRLNRLDTADPSPEVSWEAHSFGDKPAIAALAELTHWQCRIRQAEGVMLDYFMQKFLVSYYRFEALDAAIIPENCRVPLGGEFKADIVLVPSNPGTRPTVLANGRELNEYANGRTVYREKADRLGKKQVLGVIQVMEPQTGQYKEYTFETEYEVVKP